jgi:hypothetical protein
MQEAHMAWVRKAMTLALMVCFLIAVVGCENPAGSSDDSDDNGSTTEDDVANGDDSAGDDTSGDGAGDDTSDGDNQSDGDTSDGDDTGDDTSTDGSGDTGSGGTPDISLAAGTYFSTAASGQTASVLPTSLSGADGVAVYFSEDTTYSLLCWAGDQADSYEGDCSELGFTIVSEGVTYEFHLHGQDGTEIAVSTAGEPDQILGETESWEAAIEGFSGNYPDPSAYDWYEDSVFTCKIDEYDFVADNEISAWTEEYYYDHLGTEALKLSVTGSMYTPESGSYSSEGVSVVFPFDSDGSYTVSPDENSDQKHAYWMYFGHWGGVVPITDDDPRPAGHYRTWNAFDHPETYFELTVHSDGTDYWGTFEGTVKEEYAHNHPERYFTITEGYFSIPVDAIEHY